LNVDKATRYHRLRRRAELSGTVAAGVFLVITVYSGLAVRLREVSSMVGGSLPPAVSDVVSATIIAAALTVMIAVVETPLAWYQGFVLEHRYGLSSQTPGRWISDHLKATLLATLFAMLGAAVVYGALAWSTEWWWALAAGVLSLVTIVIVTLAPVALLPLFYAFRPLDRPELVERLLSLASRANTNIVGVFEWRLSDHTRKANAALAGLGRTRRILLSDTLLADYSDDEIEVVLAHELAHHVHHDLWRAVALQSVLLFGGFFLAHVALTTLERPLGLGGLSDPAGLPLLMLVGGLFSFVFVPVANAFSRSHERRADQYALETTQNARAFVSAMRRLAQQNLAEERPSRLVQWLFYSHPPIRERILTAEQWQDAQTSASPRPA
jgi:STE24 endopeptidase